MIDYILEISFHPDLEELIHGRLFFTRSTGTVSTRDGALVAYFASSVDRDAAAAALSGLSIDLRPADQPRLDWLQLYQQSLQPLVVGRSFVIASDTSLIPPDTTRHRLVIPQEQAFGTGSHESTALTIELLERLDLRGRRGLDIGAGSGILALAMLRLGTRNVMAFDVDPEAFRALRENRTRNGVAPAQMPVFIGTIDALRGGRFDIVTMNILPEVIVALLPAVKRHLDRTLIASGILHVQREYVVEACGRQGLRLDDEAGKGEWWAGSFVIPSVSGSGP